MNKKPVNADIVLCEQTEYWGRNGYSFMEGLNVQLLSYIPYQNRHKLVRIEPVNSQNKSGACSFDMPAADIPKLIKRLQEIKKQAK